MSELSINTTQNVNINFTAASIGQRILAFGTDLLIIIAYFIVAMTLLYYSGLGDAMDKMDGWSAGAIMVLITIPITFYSIFWESLFDGQTLGKRLLKIKVVKIDGYQASFGDYFVRWLFRLVDIVFTSGTVGFISIVVTDKSQRLGDIAAGTAIISLKNDISINSTILEDINDDYVPVYPLVIKLSDNDVRIIKDNFERAKKHQDYEITRKLKDKIETVTGIKNQSGNDADFIKTVLKDYNYYTQNM
ncbi:putative RDD family membrane protein YckC [Flavobacterium arsenatis]|uniref:RDD family membrane protein YckC n=1 Tax=Flavobacterium arsenatis TaxID=1484332 RepID=A0ABU1TNW9_9FLAO|nr:RDD family protein [Flavobacterium arsenatis]MDR6967660.1 putative RDD family membrane protein YckC [Flavobacterium arsenatis]